MNKNYVSSREDDIERDNAEMVWVKINIKGCKYMYISGCYRAKVDDAETLDALDAALQRLCGRNNSPILLAGDFNLPGWDWANKTLKQNCPYPSLHNKFGDIISDHGLTQTVDAHTRLDIIHLT